MPVLVTYGLKEHNGSIAAAMSWGETPAGSALLPKKVEHCHNSAEESGRNGIALPQQHGG